MSGGEREGFLAPRMRRFRRSPSQLAAVRVRELVAAGHDIVKLTTGEPDFPTPDVAKAAAARAMRENAIAYTPVNGTLEMREAVRAKFRRDNGLDYGLDEIAVGTEPDHGQCRTQNWLIGVLGRYHHMLDPGTEYASAHAGHGHLPGSKTGKLRITVTDGIAVHHQVLPVDGDLGVEVVHHHAHGGLHIPRGATPLRSPGRSNGLRRTLLFEHRTTDPGLHLDHDGSLRSSLEGPRQAAPD